MNKVVIDAARLRYVIRQIFVAAGVSQRSADTVAEALVDAECEGLPSHGVMLIPMYVERIRQGSVSLRDQAAIVHDNSTIAVLDAGNCLGQISADQAMTLAVEKAQKFGLGAVATRNAFHFGATRRYTLAAAARGCIGIAMCNTRPLMPAPGGAESIVGNNPLSIALPGSEEEPPVVLDMALSEVAMGKIRMAEAEGKTIPANWATDASGTPTTSPAEAIKGMLLPAAGPKGFGLAFVIDLLCGALSSGGWGARVKPLFGDPAEAYNSAHFFMAISVEHFRPPADFKEEISAAAQRIRQAKKANGIERLYSPGEIEWQRRQDKQDRVTIPQGVAASLKELIEKLDLDIPEFS